LDFPSFLSKTWETFGVGLEFLGVSFNVVVGEAVPLNLSSNYTPRAIFMKNTHGIVLYLRK